MSTAIVIVGLGETGIACVSHFHALQIPVVVVDSRNFPPKLTAFRHLYPDVPVYTGGFKEEILKQARCLIVSPGISKDHPDIIKAVSPDTEIIGDIELFAKTVNASVIAITGSNGKSTVTTLVGEMAKQAGLSVGVGGNLGIPVLTLLKQKPALYVLELSSFQLETTYSLKPTVATILNLSLDHMDRYASMEAYQAAKRRIWMNCKQAVINRDDPTLAKSVPEEIPTISFGLEQPLEDQFGLIPRNNELWLAEGSKLLLPLSQLKLFGLHNVANTLAALALGKSASFPIEAMLAVLETFSGLPHRCEWVRKYKEVHWINDSKGTNVGATTAALRGLAADIPGKWILIAGGVGKKADFTPLQPLIKQHCRAVVLIGEAAQELENLLQASVYCSRAISMEDAIYKAVRLAKPGDGVLLSPACASWDMFKNFEERGDAFKVAVNALVK
jgi:UDP-N-acetylmuramoylalanine--D-glutamate ligase